MLTQVAKNHLSFATAFFSYFLFHVSIVLKQFQTTNAIKLLLQIQIGFLQLKSTLEIHDENVSEKDPISDEPQNGRFTLK
jgi:hypothetical protein